ncbi:MAG: GAF domain-containing sensor histidine kinase [Anaerolineales bacterium]|nr:GAF domain-containing sensor histidine kinase [Anaerolineales bacterium]
MTDKAEISQISRYKKIISISRDLASTLDLDILLKRIVQAAAELTGAEAASILLYDERLERLYFQVASQFDGPLLRGLDVPVESSIAGWIVKNRQPMIIHDTKQDERHYQQVGQSLGITTKSLLGVPLIAKDKVSGVLEAINKRNGKFSSDDQEALMTLGVQAAVAIENSRLFQQFDLISEFVHELRTPLASLRTATHLLTHPEITDDKREQLAKNIQRERVRLAEMSTDFLNVARLESGRSQFQIDAFDLNVLLNECFQLIIDQAEESGLFCNIEIPDELPMIKGDCDKIKQAVLNLLSNAIKYTLAGGRVLLKAEAAPDEIHISISDTGVGIPQKYLDRLFSKFFRVPGSERMSQGTGLGLSIVKRIIEGHGGHIEVESEVDVGTTFTIHLLITP